jgi:hypothetical protein
MKKAFGLRKISALAMASVMILASCTKTDETANFSTQDSQNISNDGAIEAHQDEMTDMATTALNGNDPAGRTEADDRIKCAIITLSPNSTKEAGTITLDFATGCTDSKGNVRKGKLIVAWTGGRWFVPKSSHTVTSNGYTINGILIEGTRTVTNVTTNIATPAFTISGAYTSTWPDKSTATRIVNLTKQWNIADGKVIISQTDGTASAATGNNRFGKLYVVTITTPLEYLTSCVGTSKIYLPVKGVKEISVDQKKYAVDFGTGTCDNTFTVSFNGNSKEFTANNE